MTLRSTGPGRATALALLMLAGTAQAVLVERGGGMVYDTDRHITWLQDWNLAKTTGAAVDGTMGWAEVKAWVDGLEFGGYSDWRLPTALNPDGSGPCVDFICSGSEMGHVWLTELGNTPFCGLDLCTSGAQPGWGLANTGPFRNMQTDHYGAYWTSTEYDGTRGWFFSVKYGQQEFGEDPMFEYAVAVRDGDVTAVPEPALAALLALGLGTVAAAGRRRVSRSCGRAGAGSS